MREANLVHYPASTWGIRTMGKLALLALFLVTANFLDGCSQQMPDDRPNHAGRVLQRHASEIVSQLERVWPNNRVVNIVAFGNSVPAGYAKTPEVRPFDAYPHQLHQRLNAAYPHAVINVIVSAAGGETSEEGLARMDATVLNHSPDVLLVDYGLNDRSIGTERSRNALTKIVGKARAAGLLVMLLTPTGDSEADLSNLGDPLNVIADMIRKVAQQEGVDLVDSTAAFRDYPGSADILYAQTNHPSRSGHELVAKALMEHFRR